MPARSHGLAVSDETGRRPRVYSIWSTMKDRCLNPHSPGFVRYGGRGISVCERWLTFANFLADMGHPDEGMSIDRIDSNGNYEPGNCRWASKIEQARNQRNNHVIEYQGQRKSMAEWCEELRLNYSIVRRRLRMGDTPEQAFSEGRRKPNASIKFDDDVVEAIRNAEGSQSAIGKRFGVSQTYVSAIKRGLLRSKKSAKDHHEQG